MTESLDITTEDEEPKRRKGFWAKLKRGLSMTHTEIIERVGAALEGRGVIDDETLDDLEESLIAADLGVETSLELMDSVRQRVQSGQGGDVIRLREMLADEVSVLLLDAPRLPPRGTPCVTLVVGVNGAGKTTSIAKLAHRSKEDGERVLLAAADTFRAAAIEQLQIWGERIAVDVVSQKAGSDPAAVVFDALAAAKARSVDHVIVDTAGRLHTKSNLMAELAKMRASHRPRGVRLAAPNAARAGRDQRSERGQSGQGVQPLGRRRRHFPDQAGRHRQGWCGGGRRARASATRGSSGRRRAGRRHGRLSPRDFAAALFG